MSGTKLKLMCLVWSDNNPNEHIFQVKIDDDDTVAALKKLIKDEHARALAHVDAPTCSIPTDDNSQKTLNTVRFDSADPHRHLHRLPPASLVSKYFRTGLSPESIHILVEVPALGECSARISYSMTEVRMLLTETVALLASLPNLSNLREERLRAESKAANHVEQSPCC